VEFSEGGRGGYGSDGRNREEGSENFEGGVWRGVRALISWLPDRLFVIRITAI